MSNSFSMTVRSAAMNPASVPPSIMSSLPYSSTMRMAPNLAGSHFIEEGGAGPAKERKLHDCQSEIVGESCWRGKYAESNLFSAIDRRCRWQTGALLKFVRDDAADKQKPGGIIDPQQQEHHFQQRTV